MGYIYILKEVSLARYYWATDFKPDLTHGSVIKKWSSRAQFFFQNMIRWCQNLLLLNYLYAFERSFDCKVTSQKSYIQIQYSPLSLHITNTFCICSSLAGHILLSDSFWYLLPGLEPRQAVRLFLLSDYLTTICWWWLCLREAPPPNGCQVRAKPTPTGETWNYNEHKPTLI